MASDKSRRLTADQARELFRNLHDEESENSLDECDSDFSSNESRFRVIIQKLEGESQACKCAGISGNFAWAFSNSLEVWNHECYF